MVRVVKVHAYGGPEVLTVDQASVAEPGPGQAHIRQTAMGLNFIDTYHRTGLYPQPSFPFIPGSEGAGVVLAVGSGVTDITVGDRVAYTVTLGGYAEERLVPADRLVKLPDAIDDQTAAAIMLKGMTAEYLIRRTYPVTKGTVLLFHAVAGGVGQIATQWAVSLGATVIGTVGSADKAKLAQSLGCTHIINYREENFVERVKAITGGRGVDVVYDSVGRDTFPGSLDCLKPRGLWASFGQSSGALDPMSIGLLSQKGSLFATRPTLFHYIASRADLLTSANALFDVIAAGKVKIAIGQTYRLSQVAQAHHDLEARKTTGSTVLLPG
jgi:NADPH:quinone reductase